MRETKSENALFYEKDRGHLSLSSTCVCYHNKISAIPFQVCPAGIHTSQASRSPLSLARYPNRSRSLLQALLHILLPIPPSPLINPSPSPLQTTLRSSTPYIDTPHMFRRDVSDGDYPTPPPKKKERERNWFARKRD